MKSLCIVLLSMLATQSVLASTVDESVGPTSLIDVRALQKRESAYKKKCRFSQYGDTEKKAPISAKDSEDVKAKEDVQPKEDVKAKEDKAKKAKSQEPEKTYGNAFIKACLQGQNAARAEVGLPPLEWDDKLAHHASGWSDHLSENNYKLYHSTGTGQGENLYWYKGYGLSDEQICGRGIQAFVDEKPLWKRDGKPRISRSNSEQWGHYTQIVWASTQKVGCAVETNKHNSQYLTCSKFQL